MRAMPAARSRRSRRHRACRPTSTSRPASARSSATSCARCSTASHAPSASIDGSLRRLHLVEGEHEVLLVERLVAGEAGLEVGLVVDGLVRPEGLVLPLAVADVVAILG